MNQTLIIITHDERIALQADRIIAIEDGRVACYTRESNGAYTILLSNPDLGSSISYVFALEDGRYLLFGTNVPEEPFGSKQYRYWPVE